MPFINIKKALSGETRIGTQVTVRGWVRTRRDSKAGFSFINVHDGSSFDAIQVVAPAELDNYRNEVQKLTSGCAVECKFYRFPIYWQSRMWVRIIRSTQSLQISNFIWKTMRYTTKLKSGNPGYTEISCPLINCYGALEITAALREG